MFRGPYFAKYFQNRPIQMLLKFWDPLDCKVYFNILKYFNVMFSPTDHTMETASPLFKADKYSKLYSLPYHWYSELNKGTMRKPIWTFLDKNIIISIMCTSFNFSKSACLLLMSDFLIKRYWHPSKLLIPSWKTQVYFIWNGNLMSLPSFPLALEVQILKKHLQSLIQK